MDSREYPCDRMKLIFEKGPLFYAEFNLRLFWFLLFQPCDIILANDLDTLPACALASIIRKKVLIYDSHEFFTEVPELINRPLVRRMWLILERRFIGRANAGMTVSGSIAKAYHERYGIEMEVVRNFPVRKSRYGLNIPEDKKIAKGGKRMIIYQGSVNVDRGLEEMIEAMKFLPDCLLCVCGDGDIMNELKSMKESSPFGDRIFLTGRIPLDELKIYTSQADLGISVEKANGLSYTFALPNKVFDYIHVGLPVLISPLPEMVRINEEFGFAEVVDKVEPESIANKVKDLFKDEVRYLRLKESAVAAREVLNWEGEEGKLLNLFRRVSEPSL